MRFSFSAFIRGMHREPRSNLRFAAAGTADLVMDADRKKRPRSRRRATSKDGQGAAAPAPDAGVADRVGCVRRRLLFR